MQYNWFLTKIIKDYLDIIYLQVCSVKMPTREAAEYYDRNDYEI